MKALLYCVKSKPYFHRASIEKWWWNDGCYEPLDYREGFITLDKKTLSLRYKDGHNDDQLSQTLNGKIVAKVEIDKVEEIYNGYRFEEWGRYYVTNDMSFGMLLEKSCLTDKELEKYLQENIGYALHLTNLKVFDRPLSFDKDYIYKDYKTNATLTKAPQNMCNVYDRFGNKYVLISIQPQHLCNILNGKKTIEVRRKVLNCLKEMSKNV